MQKIVFVFLLIVPFSVNGQRRDKNMGPITLLTVGEGWANNSINVVVFRRNSIVSYHDLQYIAYYDAKQRLVLGKRKLNATDWELVVTKYKGDASDAHRSVSIMTDGEGYLHVCWDQHNSPLKYCRSVAPGSLELTAEMSMTWIKKQQVTYPEFYRLPSGNLLFFYRDGGSGNGNLMLDHYDVKTKTWTQVQNGWINGEGHRNAYWQVATDKSGIIHLSWVWRETPDVATNHDMCYARSRDEGKTWEKSTGEKYRLPIIKSTAEYARQIPENSELINTTSMCADDQGHPYIATYWRPPNTAIPQYHLIYNNGKKWITRQIMIRKTAFTLAGGGTKRIPIARPQILIKNDNHKPGAIILFRDEERGNKVSAAVCNNLVNGKWHIFDLTTKSVGQWEPSYDTELWRERGLLDIFVQKAEQADAEGIVNISSQPVQVLEWKPGRK